MERKLLKHTGIYQLLLRNELTGRLVTTNPKLPKKSRNTRMIEVHSQQKYTSLKQGSQDVLALQRTINDRLIT